MYYRWIIFPFYLHTVCSQLSSATSHLTKCGLPGSLGSCPIFSWSLCEVSGGCFSPGWFRLHGFAPCTHPLTFWIALHWPSMSSFCHLWIWVKRLVNWFAGQYLSHFVENWRSEKLSEWSKAMQLISRRPGSPGPRLTWSSIPPKMVSSPCKSQAPRPIFQKQTF